jgi:dihydrofolate reductase
MMFNWVSADGFFAAPGGGLDWIVPAEEQLKSAAAGISQMDTVLLGRRTYELFAKFWPDAVDEDGTAPDPHDPGQRSREHGQIGIGLNRATKLVFSRTLRHATWQGSQIVREFDAERIRALKQQPGKGMIIFGSGSIVSLLTQHGLIDEYHFLVCPVLLGRGRQLLDDVSRTTALTLLEAQKYRSGDVLLRYGRAD